jgi:stringent starvation protein B
MISTKPYLLRAFYEWIIDNNFTPYLLVDATKKNILIPTEHVKDGKIIFNLSPDAIQALTMDNHIVEFKARFGGAVRNIYLTMQSIEALYAQENGQGIVFEEDGDEDEGSEETKPEIEFPTTTSTKSSKKPVLKRIK